MYHRAAQSPPWVQPVAPLGAVGRMETGIVALEIVLALVGVDHGQIEFDGLIDVVTSALGAFAHRSTFKRRFPFSVIPPSAICARLAPLP